MGEFLDFFKQRKNLINILLLGILILAVPIIVNGLRWQQIIKSRASIEPIVFTGTNVEQRNNKWVVLNPQNPISLQLTAPEWNPATGTIPPSSNTQNVTPTAPATAPTVAPGSSSAPTTNTCLPSPLYYCAATNSELPRDAYDRGCTNVEIYPEADPNTGSHACSGTGSVRGENWKYCWYCRP